MTGVEYDGDNPLRLANEIEAALAKYGFGSDHRMCKAIHFFEGELRLIAECLRCAADRRVIDTTVAAFLGPFPGSPIAAGTPTKTSKPLKTQLTALSAVPQDYGSQLRAGKRLLSHPPPVSAGAGG
jgi:hypothetical protein